MVNIREYIKEKYKCEIDNPRKFINAPGTISRIVGKNPLKNAYLTERMIYTITQSIVSLPFSDYFEIGELQEEKGEGKFEENDFSYYSARAVFNIGLFDKKRIFLTNISLKGSEVGLEDFIEQESIFGFFWKNVK